MASSPSFLVSSFSSTPSSHVPPPQEECRPSGSLGDQSGPESSFSRIMVGVDVKALRTLEAMNSHHDFDSIVSLESLVAVQKRFSIPNEYVLHTTWPGQRPYHSCPGGLSISVDALEGSRGLLLDLLGSMMRGNPRIGGGRQGLGPGFSPATSAGTVRRIRFGIRG
ncbi:hypothetical protein B296_00032457 [Ensete ventricosum]|uniref:Uncharacterized protein n=1 Tax=Ensete ventricosum TaxID=4639 RepID=A0A426Y1Z4_ENSVE|nr:hypothetical protein B296_00032457 [Ensete ventricosum]